MRGLCEDIVDRLQVIVYQMRDIDYLRQDDNVQNEIIQMVVASVQDLRRIISREEKAELLVEIESILQNIFASLSCLSRDKNLCHQVWLCQMPFFVWNLKYLIKQWWNRNNKVYIDDLKKNFVEMYGDSKENSLIICLHICNDITILEQNVASSNIIKKIIGKVDLITIAEPTVDISWLGKINNKLKIQIFSPVKKYFLPPFMCNGEYVLDIPQGMVCSENVAMLISYMVKNEHAVYQDGQGIRLSRTIEEIVPQFKGDV